MKVLNFEKIYSYSCNSNDVFGNSSCRTNGEYLGEGWTYLGKNINSCVFYFFSKFEASKTKHSKYLYKIDFLAYIDNYADIRVNGTRITDNNAYYPRGTVQLLKDYSVDSNLIIDAKIYDDPCPDILDLAHTFVLTLYYK